MSESSANIRLTSSPYEAHSHSHPAAHLPNHHAAGVADSNALPPALTPATTTRQSVALGVFSTLWAHNSASTHETVNIAIPSNATYADAHEQHHDLAASTGSVPSTTTTLTNTLPPLQSAAIRALNAPAFHAPSKPAKSTSSKTTITSQPVVVRTYSGSRHTSRPGSGFNTPRSFAMNGNSNASALSAGLARQNEQLPAIEDFSFSAILRAVDPEIRDAIDAIAEICARSRMSLANEYDAHLPPQGEITGTVPGWAASTGALAGRGRLSRISQGWTAADNTLMAVPEASSSSERLAQEGRGTTAGGKKKRSQSAYGSLKSVISGGSSGKRNSIDNNTFEQPEASSSWQEEQQRPQGPAWTIRTASQTEDHPAITLDTTPQASKQLAFDASVLQDLPETDSTWGLLPRTAISQQRHRRNWSTATFSVSQSSSKPRSKTISSLASWLPWPRTTALDHGTQQELTKAETRLREMLTSSQNIGKGKATAGAV
ncbi:hypothetical protein BU25DRAFT_411555 [Macroventuria anomochaeta]|uniref:Uncharacterized protein n=1 Tax=Macroventuria anomochaeta TaxID=301207 RepID=A0ACB6RZ87_9PLEO|nr:uncharacterized protein BU25DRAFT_411555 [Macroventuria anomochaeta]KAF2626577.1 hypothetical protein BU25DRAFT_411555 [Macroventuria anomochaeta]